MIEKKKEDESEFFDSLIKMYTHSEINKTVLISDDFHVPDLSKKTISSEKKAYSSSIENIEYLEKLHLLPSPPKNISQENISSEQNLVLID